MHDLFWDHGPATTCPQIVYLILEHWAEQEVMQALPDTFAKYGLEDVQCALKANLDFYDKFGREVANAFGYDFPEEAYSFAVEQLQELVS